MVDFEKLCDERGIHIIERVMVNDDYRRTSTGNLMPNLPGRTAIYRFRHQ